MIVTTHNNRLYSYLGTSSRTVHLSCDGFVLCCNRKHCVRGGWHIAKNLCDLNNDPFGLKQEEEKKKKDDDDDDENDQNAAY